MNLAEIINFWNIGGEKQVRFLPVGIFNDTYEVRSPNGLFFLQKLHPLISDEGPTANYCLITDFLGRRGFPVQEIIRARSGNFLATRGKETWRLMRGIEGRVHAVAPSVAAVNEAGKCLGKTHLALADFGQKLQPTVSMFRYGDVLRKLNWNRTLFKKDKDQRVRAAASFLSEMFPKYFLPKRLPKRMIHADPKISNFVFRGNRAVAMIDWDTAQKLSPLYDLGDALRSLCGKEEDDSLNEFEVPKYKAFLAGYFAGSRRYLSRREDRLIPRATALVVLGLAARFLNDYAEDFYFGWDAKRYRTRKEHNLARALGQIALYKDFVAKIRDLTPRRRS